MFALTRKTDYAIIALSHMAQNPGLLCTAREIADKFRMPPALLMNVLKTMSQRELVRSIRGAKGGYTLAMSAEEVTLASIIEAVEGPIRLTLCSGQREPEDPGCDLFDLCPVKRPIQGIHEKLTGFLQQVTLADIVREANEERSVPLSVEGEILERTPAFAESRTPRMN
ncbi:MAG: Rrf2 family transcriptional regulator [Phycisphaerales bacterium]|nr:Rrf2 family transcriptional regulator [Phycisphaerales bacterium]